MPKGTLSIKVLKIDVDTEPTVQLECKISVGSATMVCAENEVVRCELDSDVSECINIQVIPVSEENQEVFVGDAKYDLRPFQFFSPECVVTNASGEEIGKVSLDIERISTEDVLQEDFVDKGLEYLKGDLPSLLKTKTYWEALKTLYSYVKGCPIAKDIAPVLESKAEALLDYYVIKSSEDEDKKQVQVLDEVDKKIEELLVTLDEQIVKVKETALEKVHETKEQLKEKPVDTVRDLAGEAVTIATWPARATYNLTCNVVDGTYNYATNTVKNTYDATTEAAKNTYDKSTALAKDTYDKSTTLAKDTYQATTEKVKTTYDQTATYAKDTYDYSLGKGNEILSYTSETAVKILQPLPVIGKAFVCEPTEA
eukprot:CAMPEP_0113934450 /NCGR_PEP_ID=MMETSP1339-20121228/1772_1 /TAXON_ID=94617 /ORGANISM="Fibrocapsa japonica" /LENGTH=368 /DNA_ID=CAMNT_0000936265 /DNA_START=124 /DNA_END=1230 /DNA_ORIENTATION=- /assembly_acc=CAM_ASM_000762